jgi:hypothetical protein
MSFLPESQSVCGDKIHVIGLVFESLMNNEHDILSLISDRYDMGMNSETVL